MITLENNFLQAVKNGKKTIEVRTRVPKKLACGDNLLLVQKATHGRVVLACKVSQIIEMHPEQLYINYSFQIYCDYPYYKRYTHGHDKVYGIELTDISEFPNPITTRSFLIERAPQWFTIVPNSLYESVTNDSTIKS